MKIISIFKIKLTFLYLPTLYEFEDYGPMSRVKQLNLTIEPAPQAGHRFLKLLQIEVCPFPCSKSPNTRRSKNRVIFYDHFWNTYVFCMSFIYYLLCFQQFFTCIQPSWPQSAYSWLNKIIVFLGIIHQTEQLIQIAFHLHVIFFVLL